ncbi:MAG TPA: helix-turn-helix domain-containing protein, partial [Myxococcota bacterium]|nr:helix-turn-helix domain-containing protein [Myxococcota bacterium]
VEGRTRRLLARLAKEPVTGRDDRMATSPITHQQLADLVGTSRETITRVVKELKDEGWLEQEGKRYLVPSADAES